jgi:hypothetical protein
MALGTIRNAKHNPNMTSPQASFPAAYSLELWVRFDEEREQYSVEAPQLDGSKAWGETQAEAINRCTQLISVMRNNGGKPKPLPLRALPEKPDDVIMVRVSGVS